MESKAPEILWPAIRQFKHNHGRGGFVFGYDREEVEQVVAKLQAENEQLESKIKKHNEACIRVCEITRNDSHMGCDPRYGPDKRRTCPECPRDWMIEE